MENKMDLPYLIFMTYRPQIWDPFMERVVAVIDSPKSSPVTVMTALPPPTPLLATVTADGIIR